MRFSHTRGGHTATPGFFYALSCCLLTALLTTGCADTPTAIPLTPSFDSKEAAAQAALDAIWSRDADQLARLAVSESEFLKHVWPALPASAPDVGMPADRAWTDQSMKNRGYLAQVLAEHGGHRYALVRVAFAGPPTTYDTLTIHPEATLVVREGGQEQSLRVFGSMIESGGRWKIYSFIVD
jgi:hypothetical protein